MADGDDREENEHNQRDDPNVPQIGNLQLDEFEDTDNIEEEYLALDSQLNQIDACLDSLEARNDDLLSKLKAILQGNEATSEAPDKGSQGKGDDTHHEDSSDKQGSDCTGASSTH